MERKCGDNEILYKWHKNDWLQISQIRPATMDHPHTKEPVWFKQAHLFDFNPKMLGWWRHAILKALYFRPHTRLHEIFYADHSRIDRADLYHILDVLDQQTIAFPWQKAMSLYWITC